MFSGGQVEPWLIRLCNVLDRNGSVNYYELLQSWGLEFLLLWRSFLLRVPPSLLLHHYFCAFRKIRDSWNCADRLQQSGNITTLVGRNPWISTRSSKRLSSTRTASRSTDICFYKTCNLMSIAVTAHSYSVIRVVVGSTDSSHTSSTESSLRTASCSGWEGKPDWGSDTCLTGTVTVGKETYLVRWLHSFWSSWWDLSPVGLECVDA